MAFGLKNQEIRGLIMSQLIHFLVILMTDITIWSPCWVMNSRFIKLKNFKVSKENIILIEE